MAKVNVSLSDELLDAVDELAGRLHRSRSGLVQEATAHYVASVRETQAREERRRAIEGAITDARALSTLVPAGEDTTELIRRDRDGDYGSGQRHE
jgi:metal-responsive CopG/Arc/MetJ family transcriptional regulator